MGTEDAKKTSRLKLAIDIGHENVVVAVYNQSAERAECIATRDGGYQFSSSVYFESNEHCIVGDVAKSQINIEPEKVAQHYKKELGTTKTIPIAADGQTPKLYTPEQLTALTIKEAMVNVEREYGKEAVKNAEITVMVPAAFGTTRREAVCRAAEIAGLPRIERLFDEPMAGLTSYIESLKGKTKAEKVDETVLLVDIGSSTSDYFAAECKGNRIRPILKDGDLNLGGEDFTNALTEHCKKKLNWPSEAEQQKLDQAQKRRLKQEETMLTAAVETSKKRLSRQERDQAVITLNGKPVLMENTREELDACTQHLKKRQERNLKKVKENLGNTRIDVVVLTGGGSCMVQTKETVKKIFPEAVVKEHDHLYAVAKGGALYANAPDQFKMIGKSYGLRVKTQSGKYKLNNIIAAIDSCPVEKTKVYETEADCQESVRLKVYESSSVITYMDEIDGRFEAEFLGDCRLLLPPDLKKGSSIEVKFRLDKNGVLKVHGQEPASGRSIHAVFRSEKAISYRPAEEQKEEIKTYLKSLEE